MQPESFSTLATGTAIKDLELFYYSLRRFYPDTPVYLICDAEIHRWAITQQDHNLITLMSLDKYSGMNRSQMEAAGTWCDFMLEKCSVIDAALADHANTLFLDCDQCVMSHIHVEPCEVGLSPHHIKKQNEQRYGKYNAGFVFVASPKFTNWWRQNTPGSKYMEQGVLEQAHTEFDIWEFPIQHNYGWWRLYECDDPSSRESLFAYDLRLTYDGLPVTTLHTHFFDDSFIYTAKFNKFIMNLMPDTDAIKEKILSMKDHTSDSGIVLFSTFYNPADSARRAEIDFCLTQNLNNPGVKQVVIFLDNHNVEYPEHEKLSPVTCDDEVTYAKIFQYALQHHNNELCALINNDIFLDPNSFNDVSELEALTDQNCVLSLSRHEFNPADNTSTMDKNFMNLLMCHTQDAWIWRANFVPEDSDFACGILGCDNAINHRFVQSGRQPVNWGTKYKVHHYDVARGKNSANFLSSNFQNSDRNTYPEEQGYYLTPDFTMVKDAKVDDLLRQLNFSSLEKYQLICEMFSKKIVIRNR